MKKLISFLPMLIILVMFSGCSAGWGEPTTSPKGGGYQFHLNSGDMAFSKTGEQAVIQFTLKPRDIPTTWESADETVATVDEYNVVTAVGAGECDIQYSVGDSRSGITRGSFHVVCNMKE